MKPDIPTAVDEIARRLREKVYPELKGFVANDVAMIANMLDMVVDEWDRAAARLVEENTSLRALLRRGGTLLGDQSLADAAAGDDADIRISSLEAVNERMRRALIRLQETVEGRNDPDAHALNEAIWTELRKSVERRQIRSANF